LTRPERSHAATEFIALLGGAVATWPLAARAQQSMPVVGFLNGCFANRVGVSRSCISRRPCDVEGHSVAIEYRWVRSRGLAEPW